MQKAKNVIKYIFLICFMIFSNIIISQSIVEDTYCREYELKDFSICLTFKLNNEFRYEYSGDLGIIDYGEGNYDIRNDSLILNYNETSPKALSYHRLYYWESGKDSVCLNFKLKTLNGVIVPYASVIFPENKIFKSNSKGNVSIMLKRSDEKKRISIRDIGLWYDLEISPTHNYDIDVFFSERGEIPIMNKIEKFKIIEIKLKKLILQDENGIKSIWKNHGP